MTRYLLDTNACIAWLKGEPRVTRKILAQGAGRLWICAPVRSELWFGACRSAKVEQNQASLRGLFSLIPCLAFDDRAAERCGELRAYLANIGQPIGPYDLQIASIALVNDMALVTRNIGEFKRVPALLSENWQDEERA